MTTAPHDVHAEPTKKSRAGVVMDHEYDGIREYDNPTPGWWHLIFIATMVYSFFYIAWYALSPVAKTVQEEWQAKQTLEYKKLFGAVGELKGNQADILKMMEDKRMMAVAEGMFVANCAACHGRDGGGINGVNLCDDQYKNVKTIEDVYKVITAGANAGAMPAWGERLGNNERVLLSAYAASRRGTTPATPRAPEGEKIAPWPKAEAPK